MYIERWLRSNIFLPLWWNKFASYVIQSYRELFIYTLVLSICVKDHVTLKIINIVLKFMCICHIYVYQDPNLLKILCKMGIHITVCKFKI